MMRLRGAVLVIGAVLTMALAGCQPIGEPVESAASETPATSAPSLEAAFEAADQPAREWQEDPRLAQVAVELDEQGGWRQVKLDYVAAESERLLSVFLTDAGLREERVSLAPLELPVLPQEAVEQLPPFPDGALAPDRLLAAAEPTRACELQGVTLVVYTTGAPATWDDQAQVWSQPPDWRAVLADEQGNSVAVDPVSGAGFDGTC